VDPRRLKAEPTLELNTTAYWMRQRFGVSPLFFSCFHSPTSLVKSGSASLIRTEGGKRVALGERYLPHTSWYLHCLISFPDGFYRISSGFSGPVAHVWFSHSLIEGQSSTYIIHGCPETAKDLILSYVDRINSTIRPLSIDAILFEFNLYEWGQGLSAPRNQLVAYVRFDISHTI